MIHDTKTMKKRSARTDLLIRYDPDAQKLLFYDVVSETKGSEIASHGGRPKLDLPVELTKAKGPDEAERAVGACVLAFIDFHNEEKIGLRDYDQVLAEHTSQQRSAAGEGNVDAQFALAMEHIDRAMKKNSPTDIKKAESYLRWASERGSAAAADYLQHQWERIKAHLERKGKP
jgi:hypothetical protein